MTNHSLTAKGVFKTLGPGLLFAGAAIGVSHLVQATRAGANFGFGLVWVIFLAHLSKYPFFVMGPRYVAATGDNLLKGYLRVGRWAFSLVLLVSFLSMFTIQAAVTIVTAGLASLMFGQDWPMVLWSGILLASCVFILVLGKYAVLDRFIKWVVVILTISTGLSFILAARHGMVGAQAVAPPPLFNLAGISFLLALMGWMPAPLDISIWNSIWTEEKMKVTGHRPTRQEAVFDFNVGYFACIVTALLFMGLGAYVMFGTGEQFSGSGAVFAGQVVTLYTRTLGEWSYPLILMAAFSTMFSTTITCLDAFPRVFKEAMFLIHDDWRKYDYVLYLSWILLVAAGAVLLIGCFMNRMKALVDLATTLSFVSAPVFAFVNYYTITHQHFPKEHEIPKWMHVLSWLGIAFLTGFSLLFLYWRFVLRG